MSDKVKAFLLIFGRAFLTGATSPVTKIGIAEIPPLSFAFVRFFLASFLLLPFFIKKRKSLLREIKPLAPVSLLATGNIVLFVLGIKLTTATISAILYAGIPIVTVFFLYYFWGEKFDRQKLLGVLIGFVGVLIIVFLPILEKGQQFSGNMLGNLLILGGVVLSSLYEIFSKKLQKIYSPFMITSSFIFVTAIAILPLFIFDLIISGMWWRDVTAAGLASIAYIIIFTTILGYALHQYAIRHGGVIFASMFYYLLPVFGYITSFILLGERLTVGIVIGGVLALLGIFLVTQK